MIQNINPQQIYTPPKMMPAVPDYTQQPCVVPCPTPQAGVMPVYNNIPYSPVYGNCCQSHQQSPAYSPKISTVSIEMNGLEPPKVPGINDCQAQTMPIYPGMTQMAQAAVPCYQYQTMPQVSQQVGMQPAPAAIPPSPTAGAVPPPPAAVDQVQKPAVESAQPQASAAVAQNPQQDQEAVKPLIESLGVICPKQGAPEASIEQQGKAIQTIAQFARVAEAANQLASADPSKADVKQTKEKVDTLVKPNLIKEETFLGLANIATKDTSKLVVEDKKKADENRIISMWTLAMLQKLFKQEMNVEAKKINIPSISMNEVPGIVQIADIVKKDANPEVREAGIAALINLADPQDKKDAETMRAILGEAQKDSAANVKNAAAEAIKLYPEASKTEQTAK